MKKFVVFTILVLVLSGATAAENWEEACAKEGGCLLITRHAYDRLLSEVARLARLLHKSCA